MRDIKFRAWDIVNNKMLNNNDLWDIPYNEIFINTPDQRALNIMHYTGLIDKNGKEIYEGDIVRHFKRDKEKLLKIEISPGYGVYAQEDDITKKLIGRSNTHLYYEVVGNIYENPDLLDRD